MRCDYDNSIMEYDIDRDEYVCKVCGAVKENPYSIYHIIPFYKIELPREIKDEIISFLNYVDIPLDRKLILSSASLLYKKHKLDSSNSTAKAIALLVVIDLKKIIPISLKDYILSYSKEFIGNEIFKRIEHIYSIEKYINLIKYNNSDGNGRL